MFGIGAEMRKFLTGRPVIVTRRKLLLCYPSVLVRVVRSIDICWVFKITSNVNS